MENDDFGDTAGFGDFDDMVSESAADPGGTASASASQRSSLRDSLGNVFAQGGTAVARAGVGAADAQSTFIYSFQVVGRDEPMRFGWAIAQSGEGDVFLSIVNLETPESPLLAARRAPGVAVGPATAIEDVNLLSGKSYEIAIHGTHPGGVGGTTSYAFTMTPIPEPGVLGALLYGTLVLARRSRHGAPRT